MTWDHGEVAVLGLGKSGRAAATLLARAKVRVYASDMASTPAVEQVAELLRRSGVDAQTGGHDLDRIRGASALVVSPGVPPTAPPIAAAREAQVPIVGEVEVALRAMPGLRYIAVTGTNGKTTTTALIGHLLRALGHNAVDAGNIGTPLADVALGAARPDWVALEMSSFQLHDTPGIDPAVGVVTNLSPDHLDRYESVAGYYADKARLFTNADAASKWVLNEDDGQVLLLGGDALAGQRYGFSLEIDEADAFYDRDRGQLLLFDEPLLPRAELQLFGDHNVANALAASLAVMVADDGHRTPASRARIADGLRTFRALAHRLEVVGEFGGVMWINDSKATNVSSTRVAIDGMTRPTILLLGGRHKGESYASLIEPIRQHAKQVIAYGEAAPIVVADLAHELARPDEGVVPVHRLDGGFAEVIAAARAFAEPGDVILLSPACSSYDMFNNYEERGAEFRRRAALT